MSFEIIPTPLFSKDVKTLSKKYASLKSDLIELEKQLLETPTMGDPLGKDCYKIRLSIKSKGKGKSGGGRIITCVKIINKEIFLLAIYDKSEMGNITNEMLKKRLKFVR